MQALSWPGYLNGVTMGDDARPRAILEAQEDAALAGHDLGPFEEVTDRINGGYEAHCRKCDKSVWISNKGLIYSLLGEGCPWEG